MGLKNWFSKTKTAVRFSKEKETILNRFDRLEEKRRREEVEVRKTMRRMIKCEWYRRQI